MQSVAVITAFAVATRAIGFVFRLFLARILGAELLGVYQIALAFFMIFLTLVASGLPLAISKRVATKQSSGVITAGLVIGLVTSVIACLVVLLFSTVMSRLFTDQRSIAILIVMIPSVMAASVYAVIRAVWWGEKKYFLLGFTELLEQILRVIVFIIMLAFAFLFVDLGQIAALSYTVAFVIAAIVVVIIYFKTRRLASDPRAHRTQYKPLLKSAAPITGVRLVASLMMPVIAVIIPRRLMDGGYSQLEAIAAFGILVGMTFPLLTIPQTVISSLSTALVPELSSAHKNNNQEKVRNQINNALKFTLFINFLILPVFIALGPPIGEFLFPNYGRSGVYLSMFAWTMVPFSISQITIAILNSMGCETRAMKNYIIGSIALFLCVWFLTPVIGVGALLLGLGTCMIIASILNIRLISKITTSKTGTSVLKQCFVFGLMIIPAAVFGYTAFLIVSSVFILFFSLAIAGLVTVGTFIGLCHVFEIVEFRYIKQSIRKQ